MKTQTSAQRLPGLGALWVNRGHQERSKRGRNCALTLRGLRRRAFYRPLALAMSVLLIPSLSWFESMAGIPLGSSAKSFQASAQTTGGTGCQAASATAIIRTNCVNGQLFNLFGDLNQFESDSVNAYLALHNLPPGDAHLIYDEGRADLRNAVRGVMMDDLLAIIQKSASQRTAHEQLLYSWLQTAVQQNEIKEYTAALAAFNSFQTDTCHFTLDPDIAKEYNISFDGTLWCFPLLSRGFEPPVPDEDYFTAYGIKVSYGSAATTSPNFSSLVAGTEISQNEALGDAAATASALAITSSAVSLIPSLLYVSYYAFALAYTSVNLAAAFANLPTISPIIYAIAGSSDYAGPVGIIALCVVAAVAAGLELSSDQQTAAWVADLNNKLTQATNSPPDLFAFATNSTGLAKLEMTLVAQTVPDVPSTAALPAHRPGTDPGFNISTSAGATPSVAGTLTYQDWNGATWSAQTWGGWLVQTCTSAASTCPQTDSIIASINYVDWSGVNWTASRVGNIFASTKASPASTDTGCPANATTGVSPGTDFSACKSYASTTIPITDAQGNHIMAGISAFSPPGFTSPASSLAGAGAGKSIALVFSPGTPSTVTITAAGNPTPSVCLSSGTLTSDFTLNGGNTCGTGSFTLAFNGDINAAQQVYPLTLTAANSIATVSQTFSVNVATQLNIISPSTLNVTAGLPVNFTVVATGVPTPTLSASEFPALGLTFTDNGDGTATVSGVVPVPETNDVCITTGTPCNTGISATNSQGTVTQFLVVTAAPAPQANLLPPTSATFIAGISNELLLASSGAITPVSWTLIQDPNAPAPWLTLKDNGDGTALLSGNPPVGTSGTFNPKIGPAAAGTFTLINPFPVTVENIPLFTSPNTVSFTVGTPVSFSIDTNQGSVSLATDTSLPSGLSFSSGTTASITGTPASGTGGQYTMTLTDNAGSAGSISQTLTLNVDEGPQITSPNSATFFTGMPGYFAVTTTGYPSLSTQPVSQNATPPTAADQGQGMFFTVTGLPADLQFSNLNTLGLATGTLTIQGTPSAADAGLHQVTITAQNGVGALAQQTLMLDIVSITGAAPVPAPNAMATITGPSKGLLQFPQARTARSSAGAASPGM